jgi:C4-dicarboxylate transporter DctM subunit
MVMWLFFISFLGLIVLRFPIAYALGVSSVIYFVGEGVSLKVIPQIMTSTFDSFVLLAVPLFMLAGELMNSGGITDRLFNFANKLVGHIKGGLAHVNIVASMIFAGMTGSAVSDAAGLGVIEIKAMLDEGFDPDFSAAVTAASSTIGPIIPPSIPFVLYGSMAGVSVGGLFLGGALPGVIMGFVLMVLCYFISIKRNYPCHKRPILKELVKSLLIAFPPLMTPVIIIGGILGGIFTPTEAAVIAVIYALVLGIFVYKALDFKAICAILLKVGKNTASIMIIVSLAAVFGWILSYQGFTQTISQGLLGITHNKLLILLFINLILLIVGCFMETIAALLIIVPMFVPVCQTVGIDLIQFGVIATLNLMIGIITPPVGVNLYVVSRIINITFERTVKAIWPFILVLFGVLMLISYVPSLVTYLPSLLR